MPIRVTMADVAREAGVSAMTVSRALRDKKGDVSPTTQQRVMEVVERLGYRPSAIARGLATQRTRTLGLVVPDVANPFFSDLVQGVEHVAYAEGYNVFLCNTEEDPQRELAVLRSLEEKRVDGLVLCSSRLSEDELYQVVARYSSVVLVNRHLVGEGVRSARSPRAVLIDDELGGRLATQHLLQAGHRHVGFLAGPEISHSGRERARGYCTALAAAELPYCPAWVRHCSPAVQGGHKAALDLLANSPELTALFCYNDLVAVGALQACADQNRRVPVDVAVVGYDDISLSALVTPSLTTCRVPRYELGTRAVRLLLNQMNGRPEDEAELVLGDPDDRGEIVLQPELIIRASAP